ncbi:MAG: oxygenase MpaB family protein [Ketobacter sp.]
MPAINSTQTPTQKDSAQRPSPLTPKEWDQQFPGVLDAIAIMAGAANVIMQLARLPVGHGVVESRVESGALFKHPIKRARTTITYLGIVWLGTAEEKQLYRAAVNGAHRQVHSTEQSKVKYNAFDPELQMWVAACLYWGIVDTNQKLGYRMSPSQRQAFYRLGSQLGTTLQVKADMWPADEDAFERYWQQGLAKMEIDETTRDFFNRLIDLEFLHPILSKLFGPVNRFMTIGFLPPAFRDELCVAWDSGKQRKFERLMSVIRSVNCATPRVLRQLPFYYVMWDFRRRVSKGVPLV